MCSSDLLQGDSQVTRGWHSIKMRKGAVMADIPGRLWVDTPGAKIQALPRLINHSEFDKKISLSIRKSTDTECDYALEITGYLTGDDPPLDYEIEAAYTANVLTTKNAVEAAYASSTFKSDYHSFDVEYPVETLELEVTFPKDCPIKAYGTVFHGRTENINVEEFNRVKDGFMRNNRGGRFTIKNPGIGFRYLIYWELLV